MNQDCENKVLQNMEEGIPEKVVREIKKERKVLIILQLARKLPT